MLYVDNKPGQIKQDNQRKFAIENRGKTYNCGFFFTETNPKGDLPQGLQTSIFKIKKTKIIGIERNKNKQKAVKKFLAKIDKDAILICKSFEKIDFSKYVEPGEIDYGGGDMCGNVTAPLAANFYRNQSYFADNIRLPMTIKVINRKNGAEAATMIAMEKAIRNKPRYYVEKKLKSVPITAPFAMSKQLRKHLIIQLYMLIHSMPSKKFIFHQIRVYNNEDISVNSTPMAFLDIELKDIEEDVRRKNRLKKILKVYAELNPSKEKDVQIDKTKKRGRPKKKKANVVKYHILFGFKSRADMNRPYSKARITRLANKLAKETGRDVKELRSSMVAGMSRHWTEVSKARKKAKI